MSKLHFIYSILIFAISIVMTMSNTEAHSVPTGAYSINPGGCLNVTLPHSGSDCYGNNDAEFSCCFASLRFENQTNTTKCVQIEKEFEFAGQFITEYYLGNNTYAHAIISCKSDPQKTCSTDKPHILDDCTLDGSAETSCCMITDRSGKTDCILSPERFGFNYTNYTIYNTLIQCSSNYIEYRGILFNVVLLLILSIFI